MMKETLQKHSSLRPITVDRNTLESAGFTDDDKKIIESDKMQAKIADVVAEYGLTVENTLIKPTPIIARAAQNALKDKQGR